ncbi:MAG TPA: GGDEF domain-containing protein [Candidatus Acidoferrales bacterium]|nr:GGDEF domain-containing protein [Candidatus Acidoferrales bacterium]
MAYDEKLADFILTKLGGAFPEEPGLDDLRDEPSEFASKPREQWIIAIQALVKKHYVSGVVVSSGWPQAITNFHSLEITPLGRRFLLGGQTTIDQSSDQDGSLGIFSRRQFNADLAELGKAVSASSPLALAIIDCDRFKSVNDEFGHSAGDEVLVGIASALKLVCEGKGRCYRWGGDEFAVILPNYNATEACALSERLRDVGAALRFQRCSHKVTFSIGIASYPQTSASTESLFDDADKALREAKYVGRDRIVIAGGELPRNASLPNAERLSQSEIQDRLAKVRLWIKLEHGRAENFLLNVENRSDETVIVEEVVLLSDEIPITEPAVPQSSGLWTARPRSSLPIGWRCQTDPVNTLAQMHDNQGVFFKASLRVVLTCQILGQKREIDQRIPVNVKVIERKIVSLL